MEGKYFFKNNSEEINKHEHVIFDLGDNEELRYMDTRKILLKNIFKNINIIEVIVALVSVSRPLYLQISIIN